MKSQQQSPNLRGKKQLTSKAWNESFSRNLCIRTGCQGKVLSTDCYKIFTNGLFKTLENSGTEANIGNIYVGSPTCADNVLLAAEPMTNYQFMLQVVTNYDAGNRYTIHPSKSTVLIYNSTTPLSIWQEAQPFRLHEQTNSWKFHQVALIL